MITFNSELTLQIILTLFITINPLGVLAPYMTLTSLYSSKEKHEILKQAILFSFIVLIFTIIVGKSILSFLGLSTYALQIAGGLLFCKFGYETLNGNGKAKIDENDSPSFVPLGFPIIAGPGSITAIIIFTSLSTNTLDSINLTIQLVISVSLCLALTFLLLKNADNITKTLGTKATSAILKIMGLLIMTVGINLILNGLATWLISWK